MSAYYYYGRDEQVTGPVDLLALRGLLEQRQIDERTQLWSEGQDWRPLGEALPQFNPPAPPDAAPPPPPPVGYEGAPPPLPPALPLPLVPHVPDYPRIEAEAEPAPGWHLEPPHPWRRYLARMIDHYSIGLLGYAVLTVPVYAMATDIHVVETLLTNRLFAAIAVTFISAPLCALFIGLSGTTPGKWCAGIRVLSPQGRMIGVPAALRREFEVWLYGFGMGLPLVSLFTMIGSYNALTRERRARWDEEGGSVVHYRDDSAWLSARLVIAALLLAILVAALTVLDKMEELGA